MLLDSKRFTPLHLAAEHSNSLTMIQHLIQLNPKALVTCNRDHLTPICCNVLNESINAPEILKALVAAAPQTVKLAHNQTLPLHHFLYTGDCVDPSITPKSVSILLEAFPNCVNTPDSDDRLPIHIAAYDSDVSVLRIITEANPDNLLQIDSLNGSVAHCAVSRNLEISFTFTLSCRSCSQL